jgi:hypothetical protein
MEEYAIQWHDLTLTAEEGAGGWISRIDGLREKSVSIEKDERSAKNACLQTALAMLQRRGESIPICLIYPEWARRGF